MGVEGFTRAAVEEGKRSHKRARVLLAAKLRTSGGVIDVRLRDLSRKGALLEGTATALAAGQDVVFVRGQTIVPARIAWSHGERLGIEFHDMIDESEVLIHVTRQANRPVEKFRRPRVLSEDMTDQERHLARIWGSKVGIPVSGKRD